MKNLFKFLLLGAFTLSLGFGFVGCKNYDKEIDAICEDITVLQGDVAKLRADLDALIQTDKYVSGAALDGTGLVLTLNDGTKITADLSPLSTGGVNMPKLEGSDSEGWTLSVWNETTKEYDTIKLPTAADAVGHIEILGWVSTIPATVDADNATPWSGNVKNNISDANINNLVAREFKVRYAHLNTTDNTDLFKIDSNDEKTSGTPAARNGYNSWPGGKQPVAKNNVLTTLSAERAGWIVQVYPSNASIADVKFTIENSKGEALPIAVGTPEQITGFKTTRAANSALWFVPFDYDASIAWDPKTSYTGKFRDATNVEYTLVANGTYRTNYTPFTVDIIAATSAEAAIAGIVDAEGNPVVGAASTQTGLSAYTEVAPKVGTEYEPYFEAFAVTAGPPDVVKATVDWYLEIADNNQFGPKKFGISFNADKTAFTVTNMPDDLTLAYFELFVYKLGVDGDVYIEKLIVRPIRTNLTATVPLGKDYLIIDKEEAASVSAYTADKMVFDLAPMFEKLKTIDAGQGQTMADRWADATYGARAYSVKSIKIGDKTISGSSSPTDTQFETAFLLANGTANGLIGNSKADGTGTETGANVIDDQAAASGIWYKAKSIILPAKYAGADNTMSADTDLDLDANFEPGKEYQITLDFTDAEGDYLNTVILTFTPKLPALADMFKKEDIYWNKTTTPWTLNAYYRTPDPSSVTANTYFYAGAQPAAAGAATSTFYNVYRASSQVTHSPSAPADGGYTKFGQLRATSAPWTQQWLASVALTVDADQKIGGVAATGLVQTDANVKSIVELLDQTAATSPGADGDAYKTPVLMHVAVGKYLGAYSYSKEDIAAQDFNISIMSALYEGSIRAASNTLTIKAADGNMGSLTNADLQVYNYDNVAFNLFPVVKSEGSSTVVWDYTYIKSISFSIVSGTGVTIVDASGNTIAQGSQTYTDPSWALGTTAMIPAKLYLKGSNVTSGDKFTLRVSVADRYGKVKTQDIEMTLAMN